MPGGLIDHIMEQLVDIEVELGAGSDDSEQDESEGDDSEEGSRSDDDMAEDEDAHGDMGVRGRAVAPWCTWRGCSPKTQYHLGGTMCA